MNTNNNNNQIITTVLLGELIAMLPQRLEWDDNWGATFDPLTTGGCAAPMIDERTIHYALMPNDAVVFLVKYQGRMHVVHQILDETGAEETKLHFQGSATLAEIFEVEELSQHVRFRKIHCGKMNFAGLLQMFAFFGPEEVEQFLRKYTDEPSDTETIRQVFTDAQTVLSGAEAVLANAERSAAADADAAARADEFVDDLARRLHQHDPKAFEEIVREATARAERTIIIQSILKGTVAVGFMGLIGYIGYKLFTAAAETAAEVVAA